MTDPVRCNSLEEIKALREAHEAFRSSLSSAQADFNQLAELDQQIKSYQVVSNPYTWFTMEALEETWRNLQKIIKVLHDRICTPYIHKCTSVLLLLAFPMTSLHVHIVSYQKTLYFSVYWKYSTIYKLSALSSSLTQLSLPFLNLCLNHHCFASLYTCKDVKWWCSVDLCAFSSV